MDTKYAILWSIFRICEYFVYIGTTEAFPEGRKKGKSASKKIFSISQTIYILRADPSAINSIHTIMKNFLVRSLKSLWVLLKLRIC